METYINREDIILKPIDKDNLYLLKYWYAQINSFGFATGGKSVEEVLPTDKNSFIWGIFIKAENRCIGAIIGDCRQVKVPVLWIKTFLIDTAWQRKKYGTHSFSILCNHATQQLGIKRVYVSVSKENIAGVAFWRKMGMTCVKTIRSGESMGSILIFEKVL